MLERVELGQGPHCNSRQSLLSLNCQAQGPEHAECRRDGDNSGLGSRDWEDDQECDAPKLGVKGTSISRERLSVRAARWKAPGRLARAAIRQAQSDCSLLALGLSEGNVPPSSAGPSLSAISLNRRFDLLVRLRFAVLPPRLWPVLGWPNPRPIGLRVVSLLLVRPAFAPTSSAEIAVLLLLRPLHLQRFQRAHAPFDRRLRVTVLFRLIGKRISLELVGHRLHVLRNRGEQGKQPQIKNTETDTGTEKGGGIGKGTEAGA